MHVWFLKQAIELENPKVSQRERERNRERVESLTKAPRLTPSQAAQHILLTLLPGNILPNPNLRFLSSLLNPLRKAFDSSFQSIYLLQLMNSCLSPFNFNDLFQVLLDSKMKIFQGLKSPFSEDLFPPIFEQKIFHLPLILGFLRNQ